MSELTISIIAGSIFLLLLATFCILFVLFYIKKRAKVLLEKQAMQAAFEQNLLQSQLEIQEQTFDTISQEIHDNVGQLLSLAKVQLSIAEQKDTSDKELMAEIKSNIGQALTDLRDIAKSLNSGRLYQLTLYQCIEQELQRFGRTDIISYNIALDGSEQPINDQKKAILFRIIQECLQNILKHADASQVGVHLMYGNDMLAISICDNGAGFNINETKLLSDGLGLHNIKTRIALIGGSVQIDSKVGEGTTIQLMIPYA